ncbi:hypothetical protein [Serratia sp. M24T3]|uniref:hypothetical protein n=1 Tax=Serratia sp. M24T3 TaxID=932213 RepID=UPI00025B98E0|nr:hypothetical protein [Serratia sp. M24T3]EIC84244.1 hypothetical protein SPM24T3_13141 [Serratia sp. M24T3]
MKASGVTAVNNSANPFNQQNSVLPILKPQDSYEKNIIKDNDGKLLIRGLNNFTPQSRNKINEAVSIAQYWLDGAMNVLNSRASDVIGLAEFNSKERRYEKKQIFELYTGMSELLDPAFTLFKIDCSSKNFIVARVDKLDPQKRIFINIEALDSRSSTEMAITIMHELSHIFCNTMDYFYINLPEDNAEVIAKKTINYLNSSTASIKHIIDTDNEINTSESIIENSLAGVGCEFNSHDEFLSTWKNERYKILLNTADYLVARAIYLAGQDTCP